MEPIVEILGNGLRVVACQSDGNVAYVGALVNAGSREDPNQLDGLAHFVEHTLFKGTGKRRSWQISSRMESVGGELNAYTTKEEIMLYTNSPAGYEERAVELLSDLICDASFPPADIDRERGVIFEEIHSYDDNPSAAVFDQWDELYYAGSRLAHNILGYEQSVKSIGSADARIYLEHYFCPDNIVIYCLAPGDPMKHIAKIDKYFGRLKREGVKPERRIPMINPMFDKRISKDNYQANVVLGTRIGGYSDTQRYATWLFSNILGGPAMNSVLNRELRERRGLVYTAECTMSLYSDIGTWQIYFGCEPRLADKCTTIVKREIERLASSPLAERTFLQARKQLCGQLLVSGDNNESRSMAMAKGILRHGEIISSRATAERIMQVSSEDILNSAQTILNNGLSRLIIE